MQTTPVHHLFCEKNKTMIQFWFLDFFEGKRKQFDKIYFSIKKTFICCVFYFKREQKRKKCIPPRPVFIIGKLKPKHKHYLNVAFLFCFYHLYFIFVSHSMYVYYVFVCVSVHKFPLKKWMIVWQFLFKLFSEIITYFCQQLCSTNK